uniref:Uncharacterized protein n=1 Tax=Arundo donax TaxID=35708 RepID=A0A0A9A4L7_ARUDO
MLILFNRDLGDTCEHLQDQVTFNCLVYL